MQKKDFCSIAWTIDCGSKLTGSRTIISLQSIMSLMSYFDEAPLLTQ